MKDIGPVTYEICPSVGVKWHPLAEIFPWIEGSDLTEFKNDIARNGVIEPIVFLDGSILDGRNRYIVARELGIEYPRAEFIGSDPIGFVWARNGARRHLSINARAAAAAKMADMRQGERTDLEPSANLQKVGRAEAAKRAGISERTVNSAAKVLHEGSAELFNAMAYDKISVSTAAEMVSLPKEEQVTIVAQSEKEIIAKAKELKAAKAAERKAEQAKNDAARQQAQDELRPEIKAMEEAKQAAIAAAKAEKQGPVGLSDAERIAELEEQVRVLEADYAEVVAENKLYREMKALYAKGGFEAVIAAKDEALRVAGIRTASENRDKITWMNKAKWWREQAISLGWKGREDQEDVA